MSTDEDPLGAALRKAIEDKRRAREDDDFRRDRQRALAEGDRRHWDAERPRVRTQSRALAGMAKDRARLDVRCRRRLIARVMEREAGDGLEVVMETVGAGGGRAASVVTADGVTSGYASTILPVGDGPITVGCRCRRHSHVLDDSRLIAAMRYQPGRPGEVGVSEVETPTKTR